MSTPLNDSQHAENLQRFGAINERLDGTDAVLEQMDEKIDRLLAAVTGDSDFGNPGLVKRTTELEERADSNDKRVVFISGATAAVSALLTALGTWWSGHK